jgi:hypothetical protein
LGCNDSTGAVSPPACSSPGCHLTDQPGEAAKFGRKLADAGVNVEGLLEVSICQGEVVFAIAVDQLDEARTALGDQVIG